MFVNLTKSEPNSNELKLRIKEKTVTIKRV
jgi:hypothetical protein